MSLDIKYRPQTYEDMLGQENSIKILKRMVVEKKGFQQSYLFSGPYGSGKTTMGRILARALMCENPTPEGAPCDKCTTCRSMLELGTAMSFTEVDAATNSGKAEIQRIIEEIQYDTFSGNRHLYLFDECFTEDTLLLTPAGLRKIKDLVEEKYAGLVFARDLTSGQDVWTPVQNWFDQGVRETVSLIFENGVELTVTHNQLFYTRNRGWIAAEDLTSEDDVLDCVSDM